MQNFTVTLIMLLSTMGPALVIGMVGRNAVRAVGRNPGAAPKIFVIMITAFVFAEAIAVLALLVVYNLFK
ncbi:MAG: ATP synthase F0 subunit C [PVC group bacterium]|nr:ATP synthase F0 subunit C [PVC group bacterium]